MKNFLQIIIIVYVTIVKRGKKMKVTLCVGDVCNRPKCPEVDIQEDRVIIGEKDNICTLTREQFDILKEKIKQGEI